MFILAAAPAAAAQVEPFVRHKLHQPANDARLIRPMIARMDSELRQPQVQPGCSRTSIGER